jgi:hypothetical protein
MPIFGIGPFSALELRVAVSQAARVAYPAAELACDIVRKSRGSVPGIPPVYYVNW